MEFIAFTKRIFLIVSFLGALSLPIAAQTSRSKPETVEWVYRVRYGFEDEWFQIFRKYQLAILERQKQLGYVLDYTVWAPSLHTSEEARWDYRVVIIRESHEAPPGQSEAEVGKQLFPDQAAFKRDETDDGADREPLGSPYSPGQPESTGVGGGAQQ